MGMGGTGPTPGQPNDYSWLLPLLSNVASQTGYGQGVSSLPAGLPASGINATLGPEVLYASGMFDENRIAGLVRDRYDQLLSQYELAKAKVYADIPSAPAPNFSYQIDPLITNNPDIAEIFIDDIVPAIQSGQIATTEDVQNVLRGLVTESNLPADLKNRLASSSQALADRGETFIREYNKYLIDVRDFETKNAGAAMSAQAQLDALGIAKPTERQAYAEVVSELGAPQLAGLPSPTERFNLPLSQFADPTRLAELERESTGALSRLSSPRMDVLRRGLEQQNLMAQNWQGRANQELARQYAMEQTKDYATGPKAGDILKGIGVGVAGAALTPLTFGASGILGLLGARNAIQAGAQREQGEKQQAMQNFFQRKFAELQAGQAAPAPRPRQRSAQDEQLNAMLNELGFNTAAPDALTMQLIRQNPEARQSRRAQVRAQRFARAALSKGLREQAKAEEFLASAGITPYSQAMAQLLNNAAMQAQKKK